MSQPRPKNVLLIHTDQQRYDSLGCFGNRFAVTPNLDALARDSAVFHRHIAGNPVCMPSRASLFTGRYPTGHGVWSNGVPLPRLERAGGATGDLSEDEAIISHVPTLADVLAGAGYQTAALGKLHLTPTRATASSGCMESTALWTERDMSRWHGPYYGFQHVELSQQHGENVQGHYRVWLAERFPDVLRELTQPDRKLRRPFPQIGPLYASPVPVEAHPSTWLAERSCEYLRAPRDAAKPFFLFAGFADPHHPYTPPKELADEFATHDIIPAHWDARELNDKPKAMLRQMTSGCEWSVFAGNLSAQAIRLVRQYTDAMVHLIDRCVGRMLDTLKEQGLWDDTIVVFTSDHGDWLGDHGLISKSEVCCDALVHVPLIVHDPAGRLPREDRRPTSNTDILPTLCDMLNVAPPGGVQGRSLLPGPAAFRGDGDRVVLVTAFQTFERAEDNFSAYDERFRFTWFPATGERELYDHRDDPYELVNRAGDARLATDENRLFQALLQEVVRNSKPVAGRVARW